MKDRPPLKLSPVWLTILTLVLLSMSVPDDAAAQTVEVDVAPLVEASCLQCHGDRTVTQLNLTRLGFDLTDLATFKAWEKVYERVERGEMPPAAAAQPDAPIRLTPHPSSGHAPSHPGVEGLSDTLSLLGV